MPTSETTNPDYQQDPSPLIAKTLAFAEMTSKHNAILIEGYEQIIALLKKTGYSPLGAAVVQICDDTIAKLKTK